MITGTTEELGGDLEVRGLTYRYPGASYTLFNERHCIFPAGRTCLIVGKNGSGKSTFGQLIAGLQKPDKGLVLLGTTDLGRLSNRKRAARVRYLPQASPARFLLPSLQAEIGLELHWRRYATDAVESLLHRFALPLDLTLSPLDLSINEAWRFGLALLEIANPQIAFVDETPSFGPLVNRQVWKSFCQARNRGGHITLLAVQRFPCYDLGEIDICNLK